MRQGWSSGSDSSIPYAHITDTLVASLFAGAANVGSWSGNGNLRLESFPPESEWGEDEARRLISIAENSCDHVVSIERPGRAKDGSCYTMRGICMDHLLAPVDRVIELARESNPDLVVTAIGDGGNELGFGKRYDETIKSEKILMPDKCVSVVSCDHLIVASVSNWGGFGLAAAAGMARVEQAREGRGEEWEKNLVEVAGRCMPSSKDETRILAGCVLAGCRDGVSGEMENTVDGMSLDTTLACLEDAREIAERGWI